MQALLIVLALIAAPRPVAHRVKVYEVTTMADTESVWKSGGSGDWNVAANWSNGIPGTTAADLVAVFDDTSHVSVVTNVDQSGSTHTFKIKRTPLYRGNLGAPGAPIVTNLNGPASTSAGTIRGGPFAGSESHVKLSFGNNADLIVDSDPAHAVFLDGEYFGLFIKSGRVTVLSTADLLNAATISGYQTDVVIEEKATSEGLPTTMLISGGVVDCRRTDALDLLVQGGAEVDWTGVLNSASVVLVSGNMIYDPLGDPSAQTPNIYVQRNGIFDASRYPGSIPTGRVVVQEGGTFIGTVIDPTANFPDYDLNDDWP